MSGGDFPSALANIVPFTHHSLHLKLNLPKFHRDMKLYNMCVFIRSAALSLGIVLCLLPLAALNLEIPGESVTTVVTTVSPQVTVVNTSAPKDSWTCHDCQIQNYIGQVCGACGLSQPAWWLSFVHQDLWIPVPDFKVCFCIDLAPLFSNIWPIYTML